MNQAADIDPPLRLLVVCAALLYLKFLATTMVQGRRGFEAGTRLSEDAALPMAKGMPPPTHGHTFDALTARAHDEARHRALESDLRWKRIVQNDLESVPLALIVFTVSVLVGANAQINSVALVVYTAARVVHTVVFAAKLAWLRMITWMVGILCILVACGNGAYTAIALK